MRVALVSNPGSGSFDPDTLARIASTLGSMGEVVEVRPETRPAMSDELAAAKCDAIVVAGGDGTFGDVLNAADHTGVTFGLIPLGTGNDLARTLGLPADPREAAEALVEGRIFEMDIGRARGAGVDRLFANGCMGGFPVQVDEEIDEDLKRRFGPLAFWVGGVRAAAGLIHYEATLGGRVHPGCLAVGIGNGRSAGGGMQMWPDARLDDGRLDGVVLCASGAASAAALAARVKAGRYGGAEGIARHVDRRIDVDARPQMEFNVDGETVGLKTPAVFEVAGRLRVLAPGDPCP